MTRIALTDESGKWFDCDKAIHFGEAKDFDGSNYISRVTGSQWDHETLYYSRSGNWILYAWSQYQSVMSTYVEIDEDRAIAWLIQNDCFDEIDQLPASVAKSVNAGIAAAEL